MSRLDQAQDESGRTDDGLPLPSPRPDRALDDRILDYARDHAPRPPAPAPGRWVAGLATAGIVAVALLIALPRQPAKQAVEQEASPGVAASPAPGLPAAARLAESDRLPVAKMQASPTKETAAEPGREAGASGRLQGAPAADSDLAGAAREAAEESVAAAAPAAPPAEQVTARALAQDLQHCADLLRSGHDREARAAYQSLRDACAHCELPDTLEQALERYGQQDPR